MADTESQLFIQQCIGLRCKKESELKEIYKLCFNLNLNRDIDSENWTNCIAKTNAQLFPFGMQLRKGIDEESGATMWALVNTIEDEISELATDYIPSQLTYLDKLIEAIITAPDEEFFITLTHALNLLMVASNQEEEEEATSTQLTANNLSKAERSAFIEVYCEDGWLSRTRFGYLTLGFRGILELMFKFREQYEGYFFNCTLCDAPITQGSKCDGQECEGRFHQSCLAQTRRGATQCPSCKTKWNPTRIGPPQDEEFNGKRNSSPAPSEDEEPPTQTKRVKREAAEDFPPPVSRSRHRRA